ncbi:MAG: endo-1,4-beta-xylanase [Candidatus Hodarchaeota archaeon]
MDKNQIRLLISRFFICIWLIQWVPFIPVGGALSSGLAREVRKAPKARKDMWELTPEERQILAHANARIEKYRTGTANLSFFSTRGKPVANVAVKIEQTQHEFQFGANHSIHIWKAIAQRKYGMRSEPNKKFKISGDQIKKYTEKFIQFANYTSLPVRWIIYEPRKDEIKYDVYEREIQYLHKNGFKVLAHMLVWNNNTPPWVPADCNKLAKAVEKRVRDFVSYYKGKIDYFLVFNEPARPFRRLFAKDKMTNCIRRFGKESFVSMPFKVARTADPTAKLMINEIAIREQHGFPDLLRSLRDSKGKNLYDIIGIQSHMHKGIWPLDGVWEVCEGYSTFGVPIHFTEVTVLSGTPMSGKRYGMVTTPEGERRQAEYVVNLYTTLFSHPAVEAIQWWNLTDLGAWKGAPAGLLRDDMSPKPAYYALMDLIKRKWWTKTQTKTSKQGECTFKGFFGNYKITVTPLSGEARTVMMSLTKDGERSFRFILE